MIAQNQPSSRATRTILAILLVVHLALAFWYGTSTPYRQGGILLNYGHQRVEDIGAPDERQHANYIAHLVDGKGFPVFDPKAPDLYESYESHQPPLYYGLAVGYAKLIGLDGDRIRSSEGKAVRWINLLFGGAIVWGAYALGRKGYGRRDVGLLAAAFVALLPMNVALSGAASNDPLLIALFVWTVAFAAQGVRTGWTLKLAALCGVLAGLAVLTKTTGLALLPILAVAALLRRPTVPQFAVVLLPALLLPLPWILRNQSLYGEPFALRAFQTAFTGSAQSSAFIDGMGFGLLGYLVHWLGWWTARSFIGAFGYMDIWLNDTGSPYKGSNTMYAFVLVLMLAAFVGWLLRLREAEANERRLHLLGLVATAVVAALFLRFTLQYFQSQARYLFPALGPIAVGVAWGALRLGRGNWKIALAAIAVPLLAVALLAGSILPAEFAKRT